MQPYPHRYAVRASATSIGDVPVDGQGLPTIATAPPAEFGGPGDRWSPETLLCAAVADCFVLSFRAVARATKVEWSSLDCEVKGTLDRVDGKPRFTRIDVSARLRAPLDTDRDKAEKALERAEQVCLISNSLLAERHLNASVDLG